MARAFLVYGPRGAGKTTTTLQLADNLTSLGYPVGGFFQRAVVDDLGRRGYDLVSVADRSQSLPLARPGAVEQPGTSTVCTFAFDQEGFASGLSWLERDARSCRVLLIDEVSKLEVRGVGHAAAVRWCLGLDESVMVILSVRGDQLFYVVENFGLYDQIAGYLEIPSSEADVAAEARSLAAALHRTLIPGDFHCTSK